MTMKENGIFDPRGPWTRPEVESWIQQNILTNISKYESPSNRILQLPIKEYHIIAILPQRKIGFKEYSMVSIKYYGADLNYSMWNIDIMVDKPNLKYMLCIGGPFDGTYENQFYAAEHDYAAFNQSSKENKNYSSVLLHRSLLK